MTTPSTTSPASAQARTRGEGASDAAAPRWLTRPRREHVRRQRRRGSSGRIALAVDQAVDEDAVEDRQGEDRQDRAEVDPPECGHDAAKDRSEERRVGKECRVRGWPERW